MIRAHRQDDVLHIDITGRFDFNCHQEFRAVYETSEARRFVVNLKDVDYLDSSALGMLLLLRERSEDSGPVRIVNCRPAVRHILEIAHFNAIFAIA